MPDEAPHPAVSALRDLVDVLDKRHPMPADVQAAVDASRAVLAVAACSAAPIGLQLSNLATVTAETARALERVGATLETLVESHEALVGALMVDEDDDAAHGALRTDLEGNPLPRERDQTQSLDRPPRQSPSSAIGGLSPSGVVVDDVVMRRSDPNGGL